ncbi:hypothetical protein S245_068416 [Arachis hypogaea]
MHRITSLDPTTPCPRLPFHAGKFTLFMTRHLHHWGKHLQRPYHQHPNPATHVSSLLHTTHYTTSHSSHSSLFLVLLPNSLISPYIVGSIQFLPLERKKKLVAGFIGKQSRTGRNGYLNLTLPLMEKVSVSI